MTANQAQEVVIRLSGFWPSPPITDPEAIAWAEELTKPELAITATEALGVLRKASYSGQTYRPRPGEVVAAVLSERRANARIADTSTMLATRRADAVSPERTSQWCRVCRRANAGEPLAEAQLAEGLVVDAVGE